MRTSSFATAPTPAATTAPAPNSGPTPPAPTPAPAAGPTAPTDAAAAAQPPKTREVVPPPTRGVNGSWTRQAKVVLGGIAGSIADGVAHLRHANGPDLPTSAAVTGVDLQRYAGTWYELARLPVRFQDAETVSTAEYAPRPDGSVGVRNTAWLGNWRQAQITGTATPVNGANGARLRVGFGGVLRAIPTPRAGNYWVLDLAADYSMALVGTPDHRNLWLLGRDSGAWQSRQAQAMVAHARDLGFDTGRLQVADWTTRRMPTPAS